MAAPPDRFSLLYASTIDVSAPNGPGVNEREFSESLARRFGGAVRFVIPRPAKLAALDQIGGDGRQILCYRPLPSHVLSQLAFLRALRRAVAEQAPSLIVGRPSQLPLGLALFARRTDVPLGLKTVGDPLMTYSCSQPGFKGWTARRARPLHLWAWSQLTRRAAAIDCCTPQLIRRNLDAVSGLAAERLFLVGNATNVERFQPAPTQECRRRTGLRSEALVLGYVGGAPWERGGRDIVESLARLGDRWPKLHGVIVGGRDFELQPLRERARQLGVEERCTIVGIVPYDDVPVWVNGFDIGVAMDLPERLEYVGSSNQKIRQYLACGKPVIASGGVNEFLASGGLGGTVMPGDLDGFAALVERFAGLPDEERRALAERARRYAVENLSVEAALEARIAHWRSVGVAIESNDSRPSGPS